MYETEIKTVCLTSDEIDLLKELLVPRLDECISVGEEITVKGLIDKIEW